MQCVPHSWLHLHLLVQLLLVLVGVPLLDRDEYRHDPSTQLCSALRDESYQVNKQRPYPLST